MQSSKDLLARLKQKRVEANNLNTEELKKEQERNLLPANWAKRKERLDWEKLESDKKKDALDKGLDYKRVKNLSKAMDSEVLGRGNYSGSRIGNKKLGLLDAEAREGTGEAEEYKLDKMDRDLRKSSYVTYERRLLELVPDMESYESQKEILGDRFYQHSNDLEMYGRLGNVPEENKERLAQMTKDLSKKRSKFSRRRTFFEDADIDYINDRNMRFNKKADRYFGSATKTIKDNLERGKKSIEEVELKGQRVMIRVDFNVPQDKKTLEITNPGRIVAAVDTIRYVLDQGAKCVILVSHLGRPDGARVDKYSLKIVSECLGKLLGFKVEFATDCVGTEAVKGIERASNDLACRVVLLENVRFHAEEECKDEASAPVVEFRRQLSELCDVYVNDAFGTAHRPHSSMVGVTPSTGLKCSGFLMKRELDAFSMVLENPKRPFVCILGGAKISDKILLIRNLLQKVDTLLIGGGMAFTFLKVLYNTEIGSSLFDEQGAKEVPAIMAEASRLGRTILFPSDFVIADAFSNTANTRVVSLKDGIPQNWMGLDCGPKSINAWRPHLLSADLILWNGPAGVFEMPSFANGTKSILNIIATKDKKTTTTIIGGGDTATAVMQLGNEHMVSHVSTGGGASLELLEGKQLPGILALSNN